MIRISSKKAMTCASACTSSSTICALSRRALIPMEMLRNSLPGLPIVASTSTRATKFSSVISRRSMSSSGTCISTSGTLRLFFLGLSFLPQPNILSPLVLLLLVDLSPFLCADAHRKSVNPVHTIVVMPMAPAPSRYKRSFRVTSDSGFLRLGGIPHSAALDSTDTCPARSPSIQRLVCCHLGSHFASRDPAKLRPRRLRTGAHTREKPGSSLEEEIQSAPGLTIPQIVVPRQTAAYTSNGVSLCAKWLLSWVLDRVSEPLGFLGTPHPLPC